MCVMYIEYEVKKTVATTKAKNEVWISELGDYIKIFIQWRETKI